MRDKKDGMKIWKDNLLKAEELQNLYLATYSLDQGVLWWIADMLSKKPPRISCVYDGARLRRWKRDADDQAGGQQKFTCCSARTPKLYHPKVIIADCGSTWKALIGTGNLSLGESEGERNFGVFMSDAPSDAPRWRRRKSLRDALKKLGGYIGLPLKKPVTNGKPSSCFLVVEQSDGGYQVQCKKTNLAKLFRHLLLQRLKHVVSPNAPNDLCVVICSPFGVDWKTFKNVFNGWGQNGRKIHLQLFTREDNAPQSSPEEAHVHHPVGTTGLHGKLVFVAAKGRNGTTEVTGDGILFLGSANFTKKAWGKGKKNGENEENVETGVVVVDEAKKLKRVVECLLEGRWTCRKIEKEKNNIGDGTADENGDIDSGDDKWQLQADTLKRWLLTSCLRVSADKRQVIVKNKEKMQVKEGSCRIEEVLLYNSRDASGNWIRTPCKIRIPYKIPDWTLKIRLSVPRDWPSEPVEIPLCAVRGAEEFFDCEENPLEKLLSPGGPCAVGGGDKRRQPAKSGEPSDVAPSDDVRFPWDALVDLERKGGKGLKDISENEIENRLREEAERLAAGTHAKQSPENTGCRRGNSTAGSANQHSPQQSYQKYQSYLRMYIIKKVLDAWRSPTKNDRACRLQRT